MHDVFGRSVDFATPFPEFSHGVIDDAIFHDRDAGLGFRFPVAANAAFAILDLGGLVGQLCGAVAVDRILIGVDIDGRSIAVLAPFGAETVFVDRATRLAGTVAFEFFEIEFAGRFDFALT